MSVRRPDSSTIINHGQRLILNREGVRGLQQFADAAMDHAQGVRAWTYAEAVRDTLAWLAGDQPTLPLAQTLRIDL